jgi:hypothetical protein
MTDVRFAAKLTMMKPSDDMTAPVANIQQTIRDMLPADR